MSTSNPNWSNLNERVQMAEKISADRAVQPVKVTPLTKIAPRLLPDKHPARVIADRMAKAAASKIPGVYVGFQQELAERNRRLAILPRLRRFTTFLAARDELAKEGFPLTDDECGAFESQDAPVEARDRADGRIAREIVRRLESMADKVARRSIESAIEEAENDLQRLDAICDLENKYGSEHVPLRRMLGEAIGHLHALRGQAFDLTWAGDTDPRIAISMAIFPAHAPIECSPTPVAPVSASGQAESLRSAAETAGARG